MRYSKLDKGAARGRKEQKEEQIEHEEADDPNLVSQEECEPVQPNEKAFSHPIQKYDVGGCQSHCMLAR